VVEVGDVEVHGKQGKSEASLERDMFVVGCVEVEVGVVNWMLFGGEVLRC